MNRVSAGVSSLNKKSPYLKIYSVITKEQESRLSVEKLNLNTLTFYNILPKYALLYSYYKEASIF